MVQTSSDNLSLKAAACSVIQTLRTRGPETSAGFSTCGYIATGSNPRLICASGLTFGGER